VSRKKTEKPRSVAQESVARRVEKDRAGLRAVEKVFGADADRAQSALRRAEVGLDA